MKRKRISVVTPCFEEEANVAELYLRIRAVFEALPDYEYEHVFVDNASRDGTVERVKAIAARDRRVKLIVNARNFGHVRSPVHGMLQASGDAVILMASDLQDPPELIPLFLERWEAGHKVVFGVKKETAESFPMRAVRHWYYDLLGRLSEIDLTKQATGFGLYDRAVLDVLAEIDDPYPYLRGLVSEIGFEPALVEFSKPARARGRSKNSLYTLYDLAMLGITSHSKVPLRVATLLGFALAGVSLLVALGYLVAKLLFWNDFQLGLAPLVVGVFFFSSVQLFFIGVIGEYVGAIYTQVLKRPLVVEKERVNFERGGERVGRLAREPRLAERDPERADAP